MAFRKKPLITLCSIAIAAMATNANADQVQDLLDRLNSQQQRIDALEARLNGNGPKNNVQTSTVTADSSGNGLLPGNDLKFKVGNSTIQLYGHIDVSYDYTNNGLGNAVRPGGLRPGGNNGWASDISSNLSYFGVRGDRDFNKDLKGVFQFETEVYYSQTPGNTTMDTGAQKTGLGSRNSFVGLESNTYGAVKIGKNDTPYKSSTARMDPFANSIADYNSIMGNTGGDTRAEFDVRMPHSVWYESPNWNGWNLDALFSPGQNRSTNELKFPAGEPDCSGANTGTCNNGAWESAYSLSASYTDGPLYVTGAYEMHKSVNRDTDDPGNNGFSNALGLVGIANEYAYKLGAQYAFTENTTVSFIAEKMQRSAITSAFDERSRNGTWLALTQKITENDDLNFGWAHAGKTPGEPLSTPGNMQGQTLAPGATSGVDDSANQYSIGWKHYLDHKRASVYAVATELKNAPWGHYALGVSGHDVTIRNQDGDGNSYTGYTLKAVSVGMTYDF